MADVIEIGDGMLGVEEQRVRLQRSRAHDSARSKLMVDEILEQTQRPCPIFMGASKDVCKRAADGDAVMATVQMETLASLEGVIQALDRAHETDDYVEVVTAVESGRMGVLQSLQSIVQTQKLFIDLINEQAAALRPIVEKAKTKAEAVVAAVKQDLAGVGSGVEAMTGYANNRNAAEAQFDHYARRCNTRAKEALEAARAATCEFQVASEQASLYRQYLEQSQRLLREAAVKSLS